MLIALFCFCHTGNTTDIQFKRWEGGGEGGGEKLRLMLYDSKSRVNPASPSPPPLLPPPSFSSGRGGAHVIMCMHWRPAAIHKVFAKKPRASPRFDRPRGRGLLPCPCVRNVVRTACKLCPPGSRLPPLPPPSRQSRKRAPRRLLRRARALTLPAPLQN